MPLLLLLALLSLGVPAQELEGSWIERFQVAETRRMQGDLPGASAALVACLELAPESPTAAYHLARVHAGAGEVDEALDWLDRAAAWGWRDAAVAEWDAELAALRGDARFKALLERARQAPDLPAAPAELRLAPHTWFPSLDPTGERMAAGQGGDVFLWDLASGALVAVVPAHGRGISNHAFDGSGRLLVTASFDGELRLLDGRTGEHLRSTVVPRGGWPSFRIARDDNRLLVGTSRLQRCLSLPELEPLWSKAVDSESGFAAAPDGSRVLAVARQVAELLDGATGETLARIEFDGAPDPSPARFSPSGETFVLTSSVSGKRGRFWLDAQEGKLLRSFDGRELCLPHGGVGFGTGPDGHDELGMLLPSGVVQVWGREGDAPRRAHSVPVPEARFAELPDAWVLDLDLDRARMVTTAFRSPIRLWDVEDGAQLREWPNEGWGLDAYDSRAGRIVVVDPGGRAEVVDPVSGRTLHVIEPRVRQVVGWPRALPSGGLAYAPASDGSVRLFDLVTGASTGRLTGHTAPVHDAGATPDGRLLATGSSDGTARVWDLARGVASGEFHVLPGDHGAWGEVRVALHPAGNRLATFGLEKSASVWSIEREERLYEVQAAEWVTWLEWSPDGRWLAAADRAGFARLIEAETGTPVGEPMEHSGIVLALAFDPAGERLATAGMGGDVFLWAVPSGGPAGALSLVGPLGIDPDHVSRLEWTREGDLVATTGGYGTVQCFEGQGLERIWSHDLRGGNPATLSALPSADGRRVYVSGMVDASTCVLDAATGAVLADLGDRGLTDLSEAPDGRLLLALRVGTCVLDAETFEERYERTEWAGGAALVHLPSAVHHGDAEAVRAARILVHGSDFPVEAYAAALYDPARTRAGAAGVALRAPAMPRAPRILHVEPEARRLRIDGDRATIRVAARDEIGLLGFEILEDGRLRHELYAAGGPEATLVLEVERQGAARTSELGVRPIGRSGVLGRALRVTVEFGE